MKQPRNKRLLAATAFLIGVLAVGGVALAYADTSTTKTDPMSTLVTTIAHKFNLNQDEVQTVVDQVMEDERVQRQAEHAQLLTTRLASAVKSGKLTQAQADLLVAKMKEMQAAHATLSSLTADERMAKIKSDRTALEAWATSNNIPKEYLFFGPGGQRGMARQGAALGQRTTK